MALKGSTVEEKIWNFLMEKIGNAYGVAGLMGNLNAESGLNTRNLENQCESKLKYAKKPYCTDDTYTAAVDSGQINRAEFLNPLPGKQYGYGLAQWTSVGRKGGLYDLVKSKGVSIGDLETQLEYLDKELKGAYKAVLKVLKAASSVREASDIVLIKFEAPADQGDSMQRKRAEYGQFFFDKYAGGAKVRIQVGSARMDENGKITGGAAGDQTGQEVATQDYYMHSKGWHLLRPKSSEDAERLASAMSAACANDNIGYDQGNRLDVIEKLAKYRSMAKIAEKTEADCSSLVRGCCIEAGFDPGNFNTSGEAAALSKTGRFEGKASVTSSTVLYNGDVLVTQTKGHTVIVTSGNPRKASADTAVNTSAPQAKPSTAQAKPDAAASYDKGIAGKYRAKTALNLRLGASKMKTSVAIMNQGDTVQCYGYYTLAGGKKWYYVQYGSLVGFCSGEYLEKIS